MESQEEIRQRKLSTMRVASLLASIGGVPAFAPGPGPERAAARVVESIRNVSQKQILTPADVAHMEAALKKRNRKAARKALSRADRKVVLKP